jgi:hypothetical protein
VSPLIEDLIPVLLFVAFLLLQLLRSRRLKDAQPAPSPPMATSPAEGPSRAEGQPQWVSGTPQLLTGAPTFLAPPLPKTPSRAAPAPEPTLTKRFSRRTLMGNQRSLQDAIVVAAILGPCRAQRPHDPARWS